MSGTRAWGRGRGRRPTLRSRITVVGTAVVGGWLVLLAVAFNLVLSAQLAQQSESVLRTRAEAVASTVVVGADGVVSVREGADDSASDVGTWVFAGTALLEPPSGGTALLEEATALAGRGEQLVSTGGADPARLFAQPVADVAGAQVATVVATTSLAPYRRYEELALVGSGVLAVLVVAGVFLVLRVSTDRALRPVQEMTEQAGRWSAEDVGRRFGDGRRPAELESLASTLDGVLDRLSAVLRHEQSFSAELAHELRTPLTVVVAEASLLRTGGGPPELDAGLVRIGEAADRMGRVLETLMSAARPVSGASPGRCNVGAVVGAVERDWAGTPTLTVATLAGDATAGVEAGVVEALLAPLCANAARYARSTVTLTVRPERDAVVVDVVDDGPGVGEADRERVFDPGWRADPGDGHDGAGLGLALARRLATAAGASVRVVPAPGGACLRLALPRG